MRISTTSAFIFALLICATATFAQDSESSGSALSIPIGHKVITFNLPEDAIHGLIKKDDRVDVILVDQNSESAQTLAKQLLVFSDPTPRRSNPKKRYVGLLVTANESDKIASAMQKGSVKLVLRDANKEKGSSHPNENTNQSHGDSVVRIPADQVAKIRELARHLDEIAAELESLEMYSRADELREQAQNLRVDVRG